MSDGRLADIGVGSVGNMALWQASTLGIPAVGFEAMAPPHPAQRGGAAPACSG
jgi:sarcosine oxidase